MDIVEELRRDRENGAKRLVEEYKTGLMTLARRFCRNPSDAEELVNRTFAAVVEGIDGFLEQSSFFTWMCQILVNLNANDNRRKANGDIVYPGELPEVADESADDGVYKALDAALLRDAIRTLPEDIRKTVVLHYFMEMSVKDIARFLAIPTGTVMWRLHYARKMLAVKMGAAAKKPGGKAVILALLLCGLTALGAGARLAVVRLLSSSPVAVEQHADNSKDAGQATRDTRQAEDYVATQSAADCRRPSATENFNFSTAFSGEQNMNITKTTSAAMLAAATLTSTAVPAMADDWEVNVPSGTTMSLADATAGIDTSTLAGRRLVKTGPGIFAPGGDVASLGLSSVAVQEGVYMWAAKNQLPVSDSTMAVSVANGATLRVGCALSDGTDTSHVLDLSFAGTGAAGEGGAIVFTVNSGNADQYANFSLGADATIYLSGASRQVALSGKDTQAREPYNHISMNGHTLTFKGDWTTGSSGWLRFRKGPMFIDPGVVVFNGIRFSCWNWCNPKAWADTAMTVEAKIPSIRLINGSRFNFGDVRLANIVSEVDCESGTFIGNTGVVNTDYPGEFTLAKLVGAPTLGAAYQKVTVGHIEARASDILSGDCLVSETNLVFATGATLTVSDPNHVLVAGTTYTVATAVRGFVGEVVPSSDAANPLRVYSVTTNATAMTVSFTEPALADDETAIFVPAGETYSWTTATNGMSAGAFAGRKIVKFGTGTLKPQGGVSTSGATALVVAQGVAELDTAADAPTNIIVRSGATLQLNASIQTFGSSAEHPLHVTAEGEGFGDFGAVHFAVATAAANQWANWTLTGDTVFTFAANVNFSASTLGWTANTWNRFECGGHSLVFRSAASSKYIRFRSGPTFIDPGEITLDGVSLSMYAYSSVVVRDANGSGTTAPALKLRNGAFANFANGAVNADVPEPKDVPLLFDVIDCEAGTGFKKLGESSDTAGAITIATLVGCPTVSADQALTVRDEFRVRKTDLLTQPPPYLDSASALSFANGCSMSIDDADGIPFDEAGIIVARAMQGALSGRPKAGREAAFAVEAGGDATHEWISLVKKNEATFLVFR